MAHSQSVLSKGPFEHILLIVLSHVACTKWDPNTLPDYDLGFGIFGRIECTVDFRGQSRSYQEEMYARQDNVLPGSLGRDLYSLTGERVLAEYRLLMLRRISTCRRCVSAAVSLG